MDWDELIEKEGEENRTRVLTHQTEKKNNQIPPF